MYLYIPFLLKPKLILSVKYSVRNIVLAPFTVLYSFITFTRNVLYNKGLLKSTSFKTPTISVGNLAVGGTGKTPHVEYLINLLKKDYNTAVLSRGYKRKTKGFVLASEVTNSVDIGDEPFQIYQKNPDTVVAVDEKRVHGVTELCRFYPNLDIILLDDAFQHRQIKPGLSILLTDYSHLFTRDYHLPSGNLRECKVGSQRADILIVTKCPSDITSLEMTQLEDELKIGTHQDLFFSSYEYGEISAVFSNSDVRNLKLEELQNSKIGILALAGIVHPGVFMKYLNQFSVTCEGLFFPDHHSFQLKDIQSVIEKFNNLKSSDSIIIVTEKDAARIQSNPKAWEILKSKLYKLPIRVKILNQEELLKNKIYEYAGSNSRNN